MVKNIYVKRPKTLLHLYNKNNMANIKMLFCTIYMYTIFQDTLQIIESICGKLSLSLSIM